MPHYPGAEEIHTPLYANLHEHLYAEERLLRARARPVQAMDYAQWTVRPPPPSPFTGNHLQGLHQAVREFRE